MDSGIKTLAWLDEDKSTQRFPSGTAGQILVSQGPNDKPLWKSKDQLNLDFLPLSGGIMSGAIQADIINSSDRYYGICFGSYTTAARSNYVIHTRIPFTQGYGYIFDEIDAFIVQVRGYDTEDSRNTIDCDIYLTPSPSGSKWFTNTSYCNKGRVSISAVNVYAPDTNNTENGASYPTIEIIFTNAIKAYITVDLIAYNATSGSICPDYASLTGWEIATWTNSDQTNKPAYDTDSNYNSVTAIANPVGSHGHSITSLTLASAQSDLPGGSTTPATDSGWLFLASDNNALYNEHPHWARLTPTHIYIADSTSGSGGHSIIINKKGDATLSSIAVSQNTNPVVIGMLPSSVSNSDHITPFDLYDYAAKISHEHSGADITSGTVGFTYLPTGTGANQVAKGNHNHNSLYSAIGHDHNITDLPSGTNSATTKVLMGGNGSSGTPSWKSLSDAGIAPTSHASSANTYGISTATLYGHAKSASSIPLVASGSGALGDQADVFARENHVHPAQTEVQTAYQLMYPTSFMVTGGATSEAVEFDGTQGYVQLKITQLNPYMLGPNALAAIGAAASNHTHSYAGSSSAGGAANSVKEKLKIQLNGGTATEYNGSTEKTINITASDVGAAASDHSHGITSLKNGLNNITAGRILVSSDGIDDHPNWLTNGTEGQVLTQGQNGAGWATIRQRKYLKVNDASNNDIKSSGTGYTIAMSANTDLTLHIICGSNESSNYNRYITLPDISNLTEGDRLEIVITNTSSKVANINIDSAKNDASLYRTQNNDNITGSERHISSGEHLTADVVIISGTTKVWRMIKHSELTFNN